MGLLRSLFVVVGLVGTTDAFMKPVTNIQVGRAGPLCLAGSGRSFVTASLPVKSTLRQALSVRALADGEVGPVTRKQKNKMKKASKQDESVEKKQQRKQIDAVLDELFDQIEAEKRNLPKVNELLEKISEFKPEAVAPVLKGDWKLVFVDSAEAIHQVGSGLGKLPGSSIVDLFATFDNKGGVKIQEVVRVVGPFPNVRNLLSGTWEYKGKSAGFEGDSVSEPRLLCTYTEMLDGRNKKTTIETGFKQKNLQLDVRYLDSDVLVAFISNDGLQPLRLVFEKELELEKELGRLLRQDLTRESKPGAGAPVNPIIAIAELAKGEKKPWEFWK